GGGGAGGAGWVRGSWGSPLGHAAAPRHPDEAGDRLALLGACRGGLEHRYRQSGTRERVAHMIGRMRVTQRFAEAHARPAVRLHRKSKKAILREYIVDPRRAGGDN